MFTDSLLKSFNLLENNIVFRFAKIYVGSSVGALLGHNEVSRCPMQRE
jgi:hypothetical protein